LSTHYRKVLNFTFDALEQAQAAMRRIKDFLYELDSRTFPAGRSSEAPAILNETKARFGEGLAEDLNISLALTALFEMIKRINVMIKDDRLCAEDARETTSLVHTLDQVLAILPPQPETKIPDELMKKIEAREQARKDRNFKLADALRRELAESGLVLEDTKDGVRWKVLK